MSGKRLFTSGILDADRISPRNGLTNCILVTDEEMQQATMEDTPDVRHFEYRTPRQPFYRVLDVAITHGGQSRVHKVEAVDISVDGIAVEAGEELDPTEPVVLTVPLWDGSTARITARILDQSENLCRLAFEYSSAEQSVQIQDLIARLAKR